MPKTNWNGQKKFESALTQMVAETDPTSLQKKYWDTGTIIDGNKIKYPSPFPEYPGHIILPNLLSAAQFDAWWKKVNETPDDAEDEIPWARLVWMQRYPWIIDLKLEGVPSKDIEETGLKLPDHRILTWFALLTERTVKQSLSLPN